MPRLASLSVLQSPGALPSFFYLFVAKFSEPMSEAAYLRLMELATTLLIITLQGFPKSEIRRTVRWIIVPRLFALQLPRDLQ